MPQGRESNIAKAAPRGIAVIRQKHSDDGTEPRLPVDYLRKNCRDARLADIERRVLEAKSDSYGDHLTVLFHIYFVVSIAEKGLLAKIIIHLG